MTARPVRPLLAHAFVLALVFCAGQALAVDVRFDPVAPGVYAFIGETGARTRENEGLNANIGLVVTPAGALLIDSGATQQGARQIHDAVKRVTTQPVRWVINTGGQDHRWLGNGYFQAQGAELIAHEQGRADMQARSAQRRGECFGCTCAKQPRCAQNQNPACHDLSFSMICIQIIYSFSR